MDVKNINASLDTQYIGWECPKFDYMQTNPRHKNECDYSLMLQDMIQKKKKKTVFVGWVLFFFRKIGYVVSHKQFYFVSILIQI